jgi:HAE1 family hydrophobic/amphiphilic exporter-1
MHKLAQICIQRPVFATMLILALTVIGGVSFFGLGVDLLPKVDLPTVIVSVNNPGASSEQIETEISKKIEDAINTISGIDELRSTSREGTAQIVATFVLEKNGDVAAQEVRDKVNLILGDLPETAKAPIIQKLDPDAQPVLQLVVPRLVRFESLPTSPITRSRSALRTSAALERFSSTEAESGKSVFASIPTR